MGLSRSVYNSKLGDNLIFDNKANQPSCLLSNSLRPPVKRGLYFEEGMQLHNAQSPGAKVTPVGR
jgi:hypothetical protein